MNFMCSHCDRICDWETREPVSSESYKTIGSMYCNAIACLEAEARANGLPLERILDRHGIAITVKSTHESCQHPESKRYVLALDEEANARAVMASLDGLLGGGAVPTPRHVPCILWCRACGAVQGFRPADDPSDGPWQLPDAALSSR